MSPTSSAQNDEQRVRWAATFTLGLLLAAHSLMETGRDSLFLANIPAERLPWVYIAIAFLALSVARLARGEVGGSQRTRLIALQLLAAVSVLGFWSLTPATGDWLYYALYVWSGVISSVVVVSFWMLLGDLFTITQGKRLFASIAIGGSVGALAGAGIATWIAPVFGAPALLLAASIAFGLSALGPVMFTQAEMEEAPRRDASVDAESTSLSHGVRETLSHPYARRIATLVALAGATLTFGDYLFKSVLAESVPMEQLPVWFARIYFGLNLLSITMLAVGVTPVVRRLGVDRSLALLPILIGVSVLGVFAGLPLFAIVLLKASDGTLRYSLHKTATELLFLPMDSRLRTSVKSVIDLIGSSTAKALASVAILLLVTTPEPRLAIAVSLLLLSVVWAVSAFKLRQPYLDVFRATLSRDLIETRIEHPELDLSSAESLLRALSHRDERAVVAAMELLVERERCSLIPSLIFYHPAPQVVSKAVDIFASGGREDVLDFRDRLLAHEYASVRSAIVRATSVLAPDREELEELSRAECPCIRVSAVAGLTTRGWIEPEIARREFASALVHHEPETRMAVANAAKLRYAEVFRESLPALARDSDPDVAREAVRAMRKSGDSAFTPTLVGLLGDRRIRELVRESLLDRGDDALRLLSLALEDPTTPVPVLRHIPRTISRFASPAAVDALLRGFTQVRSGMVRYKILRGLEPLMTGPAGAQADKTPIVDELRSTIDRALFLLHHEVELMRGQESGGPRETAGGRILIDVVRDKGSLAASRIFLLLALLYPQEDFRTIRSGMRSSQATNRASGVELLENLLPPVLSRATVGLVAQEPSMSRLRAADPDRADERIEYTAAVRTLAEDSSEAVRAFALYHAAEIDLVSSETLVQDGAADQPDVSLRDRAIAIIEHLPEALASGAGSSEPAAAS